MSDLTLHLIIGAVISAIILLFKKPKAGRRPDWLVLLAVGTSLAAGVVKEAGDKFLGWGSLEIADLVLTCLGGFAALGIIALIDWIVYKIRFNRSRK